MRLSAGAKRKLRQLLDQARLARAMTREAYDRHRQLGEELVDAQREVSRTRSHAERIAWARPSMDPRGARDREETALTQVEKLKRRVREATRQHEAATQLQAALTRPLEQIARFLGRDQAVGASHDVLMQLEEISL